MKKIFVLFFTVCLFALLTAGCGRRSEAPEGGEPAQTASEAGYGYYYQPSPLPGEMALAVSQFAAGSDLYLCGMDRQDAPLVYRYNGETAAVYALPGEIKYVQACCLTGNGLAVLGGDRPAFWYNAKKYPCENRQSYYDTYLLTYDRDGQLAAQTLLPEALCTGACFYSLRYLDGFYYLLNETSLSQLVWGEVCEKTELTLWIKQESDYVLDMVTGFNQTSRQYRVRMETAADQSADQLRAQIISGGGPDLYFTGAGNAALDFSGDAAFEDLLPYLDRSESFGRDSFVPSVLEVMLSGGKLYSVPVSMEVYTVLCRDTGLASPDLRLSELSALPEVQSGACHVFTREYTRDSVWEWLSNMYLAGHIDEAAGTCAFDTEAYQELLTVCKEASAADPSSDEIPCLLSPEHIAGTLRLMYFQEAYGDKFAFLQGYGTALKIWDAFAVSNTGRHKDGAWQFIEYALSASAQLGERQFLLPTTKKGLGQLLDSAAAEGVWDYEKNAYAQMSPHTREQFECLLEQDAVVMGKYDRLAQIMREEGEGFHTYPAGFCYTRPSPGYTGMQKALASIHCGANRNAYS